MRLARTGREWRVFSLARLFEGNADTGQCPTKSDREDVSCQHMNSDKGWPLREAHRLVDDGIDLELIREPVVGSRPSLAHAGVVVTVRNGILQDTALALHVVTNIAVLLVHTDHDTWHLGPANNRREYSARSIITSKTICAHAAAVVDDERDHFLFRHCWQCEQDSKQGFRQKWLLKMSSRHGLWLTRRRLMSSILLLFRS